MKKAKLCKVRGCGRLHLSQNLCGAHYQQLRRYGSIRTLKIRGKNKITWKNKRDKLAVEIIRCAS